MPLVSVIVPAYDNPDELHTSLGSIRESEFQDFEIIVGDDGTPDPSTLDAVAQRHGARLVRLTRNSGPGAARNAAARIARGAFLAFFDADVSVHRDTLGRIVDVLRSGDTDAVFGAYDDTPHVAGTVALFRNLLHSHVHQRSAGRATTFWAGCGAILRPHFEQSGGFDESYGRPSIEDVEFGARLHAVGGRIVLDPAIQVSHHKGWTLSSVIRADVIFRAMPWAQLMITRGLPHNLNFRRQDRASVIAAGLLPFLAVLPLEHGLGWSWLFMATAFSIFLLELPLFRYLSARRGIRFAANCFPLYVLHLWCAIVGFTFGIATWPLRRSLSPTGLLPVGGAPPARVPHTHATQPGTVQLVTRTISRSDAVSFSKSPSDSVS